MPRLPEAELLRRQAERSAAYRSAVGREKEGLGVSPNPKDKLTLRLMNALEGSGSGSIGKYDASIFLEKGE